MKPFGVSLCMVAFACWGLSRATPAVARQGSVSVTNASPGAAGQSEAAQAESLLRKLYFAAARAHDLLGLLQPGQWKLPDAERAALTPWLAWAQTQFQTLEKWRYQFMYHPENADFGQKTATALDSLMTQIHQIGQVVEKYATPDDAAQFKRSADELSGLQKDLHAYLEERFPGRFAHSPAATAPAPPSETAPRMRPSVPPLAARIVVQRAGRRNATFSSQRAVKALQPAAAPAAGLQPPQVQAVLSQVYLMMARVHDLLSLIQPQQWKMSDGERALFNAKVQSIQDQLKTLEEWRYQFYYHPKDLTLGEKTVDSLGQLLPEVRAIAPALAQYQGQSAAADFNQPAKQLADARSSLQSYLAYAQAQVQRELAAQPAGGPATPGLQIERLTTPASVSPPLSSMATAAPPMDASQVKAALYKIYISAFRIRDLLSQEHPEAWKAPAAERALVDQARTGLLSSFSQLEKWRGLFSQYPDNVYYGFETYLTVYDALHPLRAFSREVNQYESASVGADYRRRADDLEARLNDLVPYVGFILKNEARDFQTFQANFYHCQNELNYAMHGLVHPPTPIRNVLPAFQGRRVRHTSKKPSGKTESGQQEEPSRHHPTS